MNLPSSFLVIDGNHIVRTIDEANPAPSSVAKASQTIKNATSTFRRAMSEFKPTHALVAFDNADRTWRHDLYDQYRQGRTPMAQSLRDAMEGFFRSLPQSLGITAITISGQEADDVIASAVGKWQERRSRAPDLYDSPIVLTADKDLLQLLPSGARIRNIFKNVWYDNEYVGVKMGGINPSQVRDFLALVGDTSDSVPGVPGWGTKTAAVYLSQYGSLEQLLNARSEIPGRAGQSLRDNVEAAKLSYQLVGLDQQVKLGLTWAQIRVTNSAMSAAPQPTMGLFDQEQGPSSQAPAAAITSSHHRVDPAHAASGTPLSLKYHVSPGARPQKFVDSMIFGGL